MSGKKEFGGRQKFIESHGATCQNWRWSWSFINEEKKLIIFGAWDKNTDEKKALIFDEAWREGEKQKKPKAHNESKEHIRLVNEEGYRLKTFPIFHVSKV